jgi:tryptophan halogenase
MPTPDSLRHQIELFRSSGRVAILDPEGFAEPSWVSIFLGLGLTPDAGDPLVERIDETQLRQHFQRQRSAVAQTVAAMPDHGDYVERHVRAEPTAGPLSVTAPLSATA